MVGDMRSQQLAKPNEIEFYRPWPQRSAPFLVCHGTQRHETRSYGWNRSRALNKIDNGLPILQPNTMEAIITRRSVRSA